MKKFIKIDTIIQYSLIALIIFLPLRELIAIHLGNNIKLISDAIIIGLFLTGLIFKKLTYQINKLDILFILFLLTGAITTYINGYNLYTYLIQTRSISIYYFLYFTLRNYTFKKEQLSLITKTLKILVIIMFILSVVEIIFNKMILFPEIWATSIKYADNFKRSYGIFNNPNTYAIFVLFTFILLKKFDKNKNYIINTMVFSIIFLTMSRSTIIFLTLYLLYNLLFNEKNKILYIKNNLIILLISIITIIGINFIHNQLNYENSRQNTSDDPIQEKTNDNNNKNDQNYNVLDRFEEFSNDNIIESSKYNGRLYSINKGLEIFKNYPIIGTGFGSYGSSASLNTESKIYDNYKIIENFYTDNDYIKVLVETGLIGFIIYVLICLNLLKNNKNNWFICFIFLGYGFFLNNFETQALCLLFYLTLLLDNRDKKVKQNKLVIYALHLNYGGIEKNICTKANMLSEIYNVEIISLYKLTDKPVFKLNENIKIKYLTENIKPNKEELKKAINEKNIINILKEGLFSLKVLYLKDTLITKSMINCNSEIIISTRLDFSKKLIKYNEYNNIKIAEEHVYHNNDKKYLKSLNKILKDIDYLMPSSNYLTDYYEELFPKYAYKIKTNEMPIETDNSISNLKNKIIISVGRLSKEKGYSDLINLFSRIEDKEWILNIVGDGSEYDNLNQQIENLNLKNNVKLLGSKSTEELNNLYKEASIYIMTSYEESFGLVLLEAASHGLPIIAYSSALGAKEILSDDNGILIENRTEKEMIKNLNMLMKDIKSRIKYQEKSLNISKKYDYEFIKNKNIDFYSNIKKRNLYDNLYINSKEDFYKIIEKKLKNKEKTFIITANPETYMLSEKDKEMYEILNDKDNLVVPDGIAIVKTANFLGYNIKERITGVEIAEHLLEIANKNKYKVYLFGASEEVIEKLENKIKEDYSNIKLVGASNGYIKDKDSVMEYIKTTKPDIIMLAMGIPLQEKLINKHINDFKKGIFIGVGGSFDVLSGIKKRAPKIFIKLNLEWLYRIVCEPKRLKRFWNSNIKFMFKILYLKIFTK